MEALMQHFQEAGFAEEVSKLAAAPSRVLKKRWFRFAHWAAEQGNDPLGATAAQIATFLFPLFETRGLSPQMVKGYRSCLASVLSRTGRAAVVQDRIVSAMKSSMELERPRLTPILPEWYHGIVLETLSKPPYEPLREASLKHLTY